MKSITPELIFISDVLPIWLTCHGTSSSLAVEIDIHVATAFLPIGAAWRETETHALLPQGVHVPIRSATHANDRVPNPARPHRSAHAHYLPDVVGGEPT